MARLKLSSPWDIYYKELKCFFNDDSEITIIFDEDIPEIKLCVDNDIKAFALSQILPMEKKFGNVTLKITIIPSNKNGLTDVDKEKIINNPYAVAFRNNSVLVYVKKVDTIVMGTITYVVFENFVVQYFDDNLYNFNGICSTLYQDIAKKVFKEDNSVHFCTDILGDEFIFI